MACTSDYLQYWAAWRVMLSTGDPYNPAEMLAVEQSCNPGQEAPFMMWIPPWALMLLSPFVGFDFWTGKILYQIFIAAAALWCVAKLVQGTDVPHRSALLVFSILFYPLWAPSEFGQVAGLLVIGITLITIGAEKRTAWLEGLGLTLLTVKPHAGYLVFVWYLHCWSNKTRLDCGVWFGATLGGLITLTALLFPQSISGWWQSFMHPPIGAPYAATWREASLSSYVADFLHHEAGLATQFSAIILAFFGVLGALCFFMRYPRLTYNRSMISLLLLLSLMTAPQSWVFDWCMLILVHIEMVKAGMQRKRYSKLILLLAIMLQAALLWHRFLIAGYHHELVWFTPAMLIAYLVVIASSMTLQSGAPQADSRMATK